MSFTGDNIYKSFDNIKQKYEIIYPDLPLTYNDLAKSGKRGVLFKYPTMSLEDLANLPVERIAADNCTLFIWGTWTHIKEILYVIESWGFKYKTVGFVWVKKYSNGKNVIGMGSYTRANTEYCLIATKGHPKRIDAGVRQVIESIPEGHSKKPAITRDRIVKLMGDLSKIELFAREKIPTWDAFGNDVKLLNQPLEAF